MKQIRSAILVLLALIIAACGTTTVVQQHDSRSSVDKQKLIFKTVSLDVRVQAPNAEEGRLLDKLVATEFIVRRKQLVDEKADLHVTVTVREITPVSQSSRAWWGSLAGSARLLADVEVGMNGKSVGRFSLDTEAKGASDSADWMTGYGGSTEDMLKRAAERIVAEIVSP